MNSRFALLISLLFAPLVWGQLACKDKEETEPDEVVDADIAKPEVELQVISLDPSTGLSGSTFKATVYGAAFEQGVRVYLGEIEAASATFVNPNTLTITVPPMNAGTFDLKVTNPGGEQATLRRALRLDGGGTAAPSDAACRSATFYFELDSSTLTADGARQLNALISCLSASSATIVLEGHCDEQGTTDYNLSLGQRRADAVRERLVSAGISPRRIQTISYGEERPAASGGGESSYAQNRRVELKLQ